MTDFEKTKQKAMFTIAHENFNKGLSKYSFFKVHNHALSEDLVQDTFIKTWNYLAKGGKIEIMKAFLYHVLNDLIIDEYRKKKISSLDFMHENGFEQGEYNNSDSLRNILDGETAFLFAQQLPQKYQRVIKMKYTQGLTLKEMSLITGQTKNTIAVQLHRGIEKLKALHIHKPNNNKQNFF